MEAWTNECSGWELDLFTAAHIGELTILQGISSVDAARCNSRGWSPAMYASASDNQEALIVLLQGEGRDEARLQAMVTAVQQHDIEVINFLCENGLASEKELQTGLLHATAHNCVPSARALIDKGARPDIRDMSGCSALIVAAEMGNGELTALFAATSYRRLYQTEVETQAPPHLELATDVPTFCHTLALSMDEYSGVQVLHNFLHILGLDLLYPIFQREEIEFGVFLGMNDQELILIGINNPEDRKIIIENKTKVTAYFEHLFGEKVASKMFF